MKIANLFFAVILLITPALFAQENESLLDWGSQESDLVPMTFASRGVRLGLTVPSYVVSLSDREVDGASYMRSMVGLSAGYISAPVRRLGFYGNVVGAVDRQTESRFFRVEGGGNYALDRNFSFKFGTNLSNISVSGINVSFTPSLGMQGGFSYQMNSNVGVDINYIVMNQAARDVFQIIYAQQTGIEANFNATF